MSDTVATWFRRARLRAGYRSQAELAQALGLARAAVANWESGSVRGRPSRSVLPRLAHLLGIPSEEIAARFGIELERPLAAPARPDPDLLAAIEEAVARGVARGLREALAEQCGEGDQEDRFSAAEDTGRPGRAGNGV